MPGSLRKMHKREKIADIFAFTSEVEFWLQSLEYQSKNLQEAVK